MIFFSVNEGFLSCFENPSLEKMALKVDKQNANDNNYTKLSGSSDNLAFSAALELVFEGKNQSCGYIEDILIKYRRKFLERNQ